MAVNTSANVSVTNAVMTSLFNRTVKSRAVLALLGGSVDVTRLRGGCWTVTGTKKRVVAAVKILKAGVAESAAAAKVKPLVAPVYSKPEVILASDFHGHRLVVSRVGRGTNFIGKIKGQKATFTGSDPDAVLAKLVAACGPIKETVKSEHYHGHLLTVTKTTRDGVESFFGKTSVHGARVMFSGGTYREVYKSLLAVLAPVSGAKSHRWNEAVEPAAAGITSWVDETAQALFNGLGL